MKFKKCSWTFFVSVWCLIIAGSQDFERSPCLGCGTSIFVKQHHFLPKCCIESFIGFAFGTHIGCFRNNLKEFHDNIVLNNGLMLEGKVTPEICVNHCKYKGFKYAGFHSSYNCFCTNIRPQFYTCANKSNSLYSCDRNKSEEICRGSDSINVYEISDELSNEMEENFIGCFLDGGTRERILATKRTFKQKLVTPQVCIEFCNRKGYKYAGITYRFLCSCDNQLGTKKNKKLCDKSSSHSNFIGAGKMYMRIYHANLSS